MPLCGPCSRTESASRRGPLQPNGSKHLASWLGKRGNYRDSSEPGLDEAGFNREIVWKEGWMVREEVGLAHLARKRLKSEPRRGIGYYVCYCYYYKYQRAISSKLLASSAGSRCSSLNFR